MSASGYPAINTQLKLGNGASPEVFSVVANVSNWNPLPMSVDTVDTTSHSNTDPWSRFIPTVLNGGEITADIFFLPDQAGHKQLLTNMVNRGTYNWIASFPIPSSSNVDYPFAAIIAGFAVTAQVKDAIKAQLKLKISGPITFPA